MGTDPRDQIVSGGRRAAKTFAFSAQDPKSPAQWWFQDSADGLVLFAVFYTQACRWNRCIGCNLPARSSLEPIGFRDEIAQIDRLFTDEAIRPRLGEIRRFIVSNNGSVLDELTFASTSLMYLLARVALDLPQLAVLSLETRIEYVDWDELALISRTLKERERPATLELAVGFEAFDDRIRNEVFVKGLTLDRFEELLRSMAPYHYRLKCYFMQKPVPGMSDAEAVDDIHRAVAYLDQCAVRHGIAINMHLNPTYVAHGTTLADAFARGAYTPPALTDVARAARRARATAVSVFIGLYDEGLAVPGGSFIRPGDQSLVERLERFNRTQDFTLLDEI